MKSRPRLRNVKQSDSDALSIVNRRAAAASVCVFELMSNIHTMEFHTINVNIYACNRLFHTFCFASYTIHFGVCNEIQM